MNLAVPENGRRTAHQLVRDTLRRAILTGQIGPGTKLVQADLAAQLRVSTTPVREALRDLAFEGLIQVDAHRGAVVRTLTEDELTEVYDLRRLLEPEVMRRAIERMTDDELAMAEAIALRLDDETDVATWVELNHDFHTLLVDAARSPRLASVVMGLQNTATLYIVASLRQGEHRRERANDQHRAMLAAIRRRDPDTAVKIALIHIEQTVETNRATLSRNEQLTW